MKNNTPNWPLLQYELVKDSRNVVFNFCSKIELENPAIHRNEIYANIKELLAHVAGTYFYWLTSFAQNKKLPIFDAKIENNIKEIKGLYNEVNNSVMHFIRYVNDDWIKPVAVKIEDQPKVLSLTPLQLFTHVITHEFHHKGQVMKMIRQLKYTPPDTDIIRF